MPAKIVTKDGVHNVCVEDYDVVLRRWRMALAEGGIIEVGRLSDGTTVAVGASFVGLVLPVDDDPTDGGRNTILAPIRLPLPPGGRQYG